MRLRLFRLKAEATGFRKAEEPNSKFRVSGSFRLQARFLLRSSKMVPGGFRLQAEDPPGRAPAPPLPGVPQLRRRSGNPAKNSQ
jgi:hypothetical protein